MHIHVYIYMCPPQHHHTRILKNTPLYYTSLPLHLQHTCLHPLKKQFLLPKQRLVPKVRVLLLKQ